MKIADKTDDGYDEAFQTYYNFNYYILLLNRSSLQTAV